MGYPALCFALFFVVVLLWKISFLKKMFSFSFRISGTFPKSLISGKSYFYIFQICKIEPFLKIPFWFFLVFFSVFSSLSSLSSLSNFPQYSKLPPIFRDIRDIRRLPYIPSCPHHSEIFEKFEILEILGYIQIFRVVRHIQIFAGVEIFGV